MKTLVTGLSLGLAVSLSPASAEEWRVNNFLPETRPESAELEQFVTEANAALGGAHELKLYSGGSLACPTRTPCVFCPRARSR